MPFQPNEQHQYQYHQHDSLQAYGRIRPPRRHIHLISLTLLLAAFLVVAACEPAPQPQAPASALTKTSSQQHAFSYVAIGASDSFGIGTDDPEKDNWPLVLAGLFGPDTHLINLGIPGETAAQARATELPIALDADPAVVTVWLGVNDIIQSVPVQDYEANLEAILHALDDQTHAHVFVANIPDLTALPYFAGYDQQQLQAKIARWNAAINQAIAATGAILIDINASWDEVPQHPEYIASDGLHPSTAGSKQLAAAFMSWIIIVMPDIHTEAGAT